MNPILVVVALAVSTAAVVGVSAREARAALVGVAIVLVASPFLADPLPPLSTLATRVVGAALAAYLLRAAISSAPAEAVDRGRTRTDSGSRTGWPTQALLAAAAGVVGVAASVSLAALNPAGPGIPTDDVLAALPAASVAASAGLAVVVVAVVPAILAADAVRTTIGFVLLIQGVALVRNGVAGAPGDLEQLAGLALTLAAAVTGAILIRMSYAPAADDPSAAGGGSDAGGERRDGPAGPRRRTPVAAGGAREGDRGAARGTVAEAGPGSTDNP